MVRVRPTGLVFGLRPDLLSRSRLFFAQSLSLGNIKLGLRLGMVEDLKEQFLLAIFRGAFLTL